MLAANRNHIRRIVASILFCAIATGPLAANDDTQFPYQAIVLKDSAPVRSGPGQVHYATDQLKQGSVVEVYRHDPGGWCAIRPTKGSFSLVPSAAVELTDKGVGEISEAGTQAWVGTHLGAVERPLWQVKLREKEVVEVLGEISWPHPDGHSTIWYQIAPPAGEFRWIQISDLQLPPSQNISATSKAESPAVTAGNRVRSKLELDSVSHVGDRIAVAENVIDTSVQPASLQRIERSSVQQASQATQPTNLNLGWRRSTRPIPAVATDDSNLVRTSSNEGGSSGVRIASADPRAGFAGQFRSGLSANNVSATNTDSKTASLYQSPTNTWVNTPKSPSLIRDRVTQADSSRLQDLEMQLTNEMVKHPSEWQVGQIMAAAELIHDSTTFPDERLRASRVIEKCRRCKTVQTGFENVYRNQGDRIVGKAADSRLPAAIGAGVVGSGNVSQEVSFGTTYDAHGWLNELVRQQGSLDPDYVLQNRDGKITHHLTPAPGVNLHRYLKSKVGIMGQRGYNHKLRLDHVTVDRVVVLEKAQ